MQYSNSLMIALFTTAAFSFCCSLAVIYNLLVYYISQKELRHYFFLYLHITLIFEDISSLPLVYVNSSGLCAFMGWFRFYSGLANVLVLFFYTYHYLSYLTYEKYADQINEFIEKYSLYVIIIFPLITLLPFSMNEYQPVQNFVCAMPTTTEGDAWELGTFYFIIIVLLGIIVFEMVRVNYQICRLQLKIYRRFFYSCTIYIQFSVASWWPRTFPRMYHIITNRFVSNSLIAFLTIPVYISGIVFAAIFFIDELYFSPDRVRSVKRSQEISLESFSRTLQSNLSSISNNSKRDSNNNNDTDNSNYSTENPVRNL